MAIDSGFFSDGSEYNQEQFSDAWEDLITNGVVANRDQSLNVFAETPNDMSVYVSKGKIWINGFWGAVEDASYNIVIPDADGSNPRIDRIIARLSRTTNQSITFVCLTGTPAGSPVAPTLTQTTETYEISLAQVAVGASVVSISDANITDERTYADPADTFYNEVSFNENITVPTPSVDGHAANKSYVDANLITTTTVTKSYTDLSGNSNVSIGTLSDGKSILSASFVITSPFDELIAPAIVIDHKPISSTDILDQSGNGQIVIGGGGSYYNKSGGDKTLGVSYYYSEGTWVAASSLNTARYILAGCGTPTAALAFGGNDGAITGSTEIYNGSTWSAGNAMNTARSELAGCGTTSAALSFGGSTGVASAVTEIYNGSTWSAGNNLNTARFGLAGCGTTSAALSFGGNTVTEIYNGSTWAAGNALNTARSFLSGCGTTSAALSFGGDITGVASAVTEIYNGSTWTSGNALNTARSRLAGCGTTSAALSFGGYTPAASGLSEIYNGYTWVATSSLNTARFGLAGGCGTTSTALSFGGYTGAVSAVTETYHNESTGAFPSLSSGELTIYLKEA